MKLRDMVVDRKDRVDIVKGNFGNYYTLNKHRYNELRTLLNAKVISPKDLALLFCLGFKRSTLYALQNHNKDFRIEYYYHLDAMKTLRYQDSYQTNPMKASLQRIWWTIRYDLYHAIKISIKSLFNGGNNA